MGALLNSATISLRLDASRTWKPSKARSLWMNLASVGSSSTTTALSASPGTRGRPGSRSRAIST